MMRVRRLLKTLAYVTAASVLTAAGCGGGGGGGIGGGGAPTGDDGSTFAAQIPFPRTDVFLTTADVQQIIAQGVQEAQARGIGAHIVVVDRVGNVLGAFSMANAPADLRLEARPEAKGSGLDGLIVPNAAIVGALAKALTGAYLSSSGNAFTTRTASQIIQENFNPGETFQAGGPLFGVQFSQLPCSDLNTSIDVPGRTAAETVTAGPRRSPLGFSGDPGGMPLYKAGVVVGGIGVMTNDDPIRANTALYTIDREPLDIDSDLQIQDELVALAGLTNYEADESIRAFRVTVEGKTLRYTDTQNDRSRLLSNPALANFATQGPAGALQTIIGYKTTAAITDGTRYGTVFSGYMPAANLVGGSPFTNPNAFVLVDDTGFPRFSPKGGTDAPAGNAANALTRTEVVAMIDAALGVALAGRAQIRRPLNSRIQVTVSVVDTNGEILGVARTPDGPIFGTDVSLQKARTAMFFSSGTASGAQTDAADFLNAVGAINVTLDDGTGNLQPIAVPALSTYVAAARAFVNPTALTGDIAFSDRGNGNLSRPFFPDGVNGLPNGPFSRPFNDPNPANVWSPFADGLQLDLVAANIFTHLLYVLGASPNDIDIGCTGLAPRDAVAFPRSPVANGVQIFAGSVPIYRGTTLVGGIGVSGDGIDQDDMISSLGLQRAGNALGGFNHAPGAILSDTVIPQGGGGVRLRYVSCPFEPFIDSDAQNVCNFP